MVSFHEVSYFLGANAPSGFYSLYSHLLPPEQARGIYILKGGPGCGKSTLMRKVAQLVSQQGEAAEYILCSGDPGSLDAVIFPGLAAAIVDGTAPHVVEPKYPGVVEDYVDLGKSYRRESLQPLREEIMRCMAGYKGCYQRAYRCLGAAGEIMADARAILSSPLLEDRLARRAKGILTRELKDRHTAPGQAKQRFLGAMTHQGPITLYGTVQAQCPKVYELSDRYGLAHGLLSHLLAGALARGYDAVVCPDPMAPDRLAHLLFPQEGLAFVSSTPDLPYPEKPFRHLRLESGADQDVLRKNRSRLRFARRVSSALEEEAVSSLAQAKAMHDQLESLYNPHVDFGFVDDTACRLAKAILE